MIKDLGNGFKIETYRTPDDLIAAIAARAAEASRIGKKNETYIQSLLDTKALVCPCRIAIDGQMEPVIIPQGLAQLVFLQKAVADAPASRDTIEIIECGKYSWIVNENGRLNGSKKNKMFPMFYGSIVLMRTSDIL